MSTHYSGLVGNKLVARTFDDRLSDFDPGLAGFLREAWNMRAQLDYHKMNGRRQLYQVYSGGENIKHVDADEVFVFTEKLQELHPSTKIKVQDYPGRGDFTPLSKLTESEIRGHSLHLGRTFYHCGNTPGDAFYRIYIHASSPDRGRHILRDGVIPHFDSIKGIKSAKIAGPAQTERKDTIVIYLTTQSAMEKLLAEVVALQQAHPGRFAKHLPSLVKEVAPGVGTADEPPKVEIVPNKGTRHSFGTFYCDLVFLAMKHTPDIKRNVKQADGRHMLDNLLWSLRILGIDPKNSQAFPERQKLEEFQRAIEAKGEI